MISEKVKTRKKGIIVKCIECEEDFPLSAHEQEFFEAHDLEQPKRCPICRKWRRITSRITKGGQ